MCVVESLVETAYLFCALENVAVDFEELQLNDLIKLSIRSQKLKEGS